MRPLSADHAALLPPLRDALARGDDAAAAALVEAVAAAPGAAPAALPLLVPLLCHPRPAVAAAARRAAAALFAATPAARLAEVEGPLRLRTGPYRAAFGDGDWPWRRLQPRDVAALAAAREAAALLFCASCHADGHVREAAVRALDRGPLRDGAEVAPLLLRRNDWVAPVRAAAAEALAARLTLAHAPHLARSLLLIEHLAAQRRAHHGPYCAQVLALLREADAAPALEAVLAAPDPRLRRAAYRVAGESAGLPLRPLLERALSDRDLVVRLWAARTARARLFGPALRETLSQARGDRSVPVRREALSAFLDDHPELRRVLFDPCAGLRHVARYYLSKKASIDFAALYREDLEAAAPAQRAVAAAGLGETGGAADAPALAPLSRDPSARVREAALRALGRVGTEAAAAAILAALRDAGATRGTRRAATEALRAMLPRVSDPAVAGAVLGALRPA